jgi:hypothetical protein
MYILVSSARKDLCRRERRGRGCSRALEMETTFVNHARDRNRLARVFSRSFDEHRELFPDFYFKAHLDCKQILCFQHIAGSNLTFSKEQLSTHFLLNYCFI